MRFSLPCFKGRCPQSEAKVPLRPIAPLALKNYVSNKGSSMPDKGCLHEMTILLTCLRENDFDNFDCEKEHSSFNECNKKFAKLNREMKIARLKTVPTPNSKDFSPNQISYLLNLFPTR